MLHNVLLHSVFPCSCGHCSLNHCSIASFICLKFPGFLPTASSTLCAVNFKGPSQGESEKRLLSRPGKLQSETPRSHCCEKSQPAITLVFLLCTWPPHEASRICLGDGIHRHISNWKPSHSTSQSKKCLTGYMVTWTRKPHLAYLET